MHHRDGLVEVRAQRLPRALAVRRGGGARRGPLRSRRAPRPDRARGHRRALPGADGVPDAGQARRGAAAAAAPPRRVGRGGARPRRDRRMARASRDRDRRRLRADGDWPRRRQPHRGAGARRIDGAAAARLRGAGGGGRASGSRGELPDLLRPLPGRRRAARSRRRRVVADRRPRPPRRGRLPLVREPRRRPDPLLRLPDRALRGGIGARLPPVGRRGGGDSISRRRARPGRQGDRGPARGRAVRRAGARAPGPRQAADRALQVPADRRVRGRASADDEREGAAGRARGSGEQE